MSTSVQILDWDSGFFGYKVAEIKAKNLTPEELGVILEELKRQRIRLIYFFVDSQDRLFNKTVLSSGGLLVDEKITYIKKLDAFLKVREWDKNIKSYLGKKLNRQLISLALQSGQYSRFKTDTNFVSNEFERLYTEWIRKSLSGILANEVLVYTKGGVEAGFVTIGEKDRRAGVDLIAVDEKFRGKTLGRKLMEAAFIKAFSLGYDMIQVVTQKLNYPACKFYEKLGFRVESVINVYHYWVNEKNS